MQIANIEQKHYFAKKSELSDFLKVMVIIAKVNMQGKQKIDSGRTRNKITFCIKTQEWSLQIINIAPEPSSTKVFRSEVHGFHSTKNCPIFRELVTGHHYKLPALVTLVHLTKSMYIGIGAHRYTFVNGQVHYSFPNQ